MAAGSKPAALQSPGELKAVIEAERLGIPFLIYRDGSGQQRMLSLADDVERVTVGRGEANEVCVDWDSEVSRLHVELERVGEDWTVSDDGLSRNGTYVNAERIVGKRRLRDGDLIRFGQTSATYRQPLVSGITETKISSDVLERASLSVAQRRVLVALCRPYRESAGYGTPATNQQIADELFLSVDAVKTHLRSLFAKFGIENLPQNQKRTRLVELALKSAVVTLREL